MPRLISILFAVVVANWMLVIHTVQAQTWNHPGLTVTSADIAAIIAKNDQEPWMTAWDNMLTYTSLGMARTPFAGPLDSNFDRNPSTESYRYFDDGKAALFASWGYQFTGNTAYADHAVQGIMLWVNGLAQATTAGGHLDLAIGAPTLMAAADNVWTYSGWSSGDKAAFTAWVRDFIYPIVSVLTVKEECGGCADNNWNLWGTFAAISVAHMLEDQTKFDAMVSRLQGQIDVQIATDGSLPAEMARGSEGVLYHYFALQPMLGAAEVARKHGVDLYIYNPPSGGTLRNALDFLAPYALGPTDPGWPHNWPGGSTQTWPGDNSNEFYELGYTYWQDPDYVAVLNFFRSSPPVLYGSSDSYLRTLTRGIAIDGGGDPPPPPSSLRITTGTSFKVPAGVSLKIGG